MGVSRLRASGKAGRVVGLTGDDGAGVVGDGAEDHEAFGVL